MHGLKKVIRHTTFGLLLFVLLFSTTVFPGEADTPQPESAGSQSSVQFAARQEAVQSLLPAVQQNGRIRVIVQLNIASDPQGNLLPYFSAEMRSAGIRHAQAALEEHLRDLPAVALRAFEQIPAMVLEVDEAGLQDLAANQNVAAIQEDVPVPPLLDASVPLIGADSVWSEGYEGAGEVVAVLDSGVDSSHEFLTGSVVGEACFSSNYEPDGATSFCPGGAEQSFEAGAGGACPAGVDGCEHGTHVAGTAAGSGETLSGVAPQADILAVQVFSRFEGSVCTDNGMSSPCALSYTSDQMAALDWLLGQTDSYSLAAVNMSLGGGQYFAACDSDSRKAAIDALRAVGVATVISSGNGGYRNALSAPACISSAISVGSSTIADEVSSFSNVASFLTFLAPGEGIQSSVPGGYASMSGTSMASPHVAGALALLRSAVPSATLEDILIALKDSAVLIDDQRSTGDVTGLARIDLAAAYQALTSSPEPTPTPTPEPSPTPDPVGAQDWYLAEGFTGGDFSTFILLQNPNSEASSVDVTYMLQGGGSVARSLSVPAESRFTIAAVDDVGADAAFSTHIHADVPIIVERAMYYGGGGHATIGLTAPAATWYLAEGFTGGGFSTYILVQNPSPSAATVDVTYMLQGGGTISRTLSVPAESRATINAADDVGADAAFSTQLAADVPVIVERAMYFGNGGHATIGLTSTASMWYLAEGYTGGGFETYILIQNPTTEAAGVELTYMLQGGGTISRSMAVAAQSRATVFAEDDVGLDAAFSTMLTADVPIIVERAMYFDSGAHGTVAVQTADAEWYLAEGYTGSGFSTYLLIQNPNATAASVELTYMLEGGGTTIRLVDVPGESRMTVVAADDVGADAAFSVRLSADVPIIVERAMYFGIGGHATIGVAFP